jgi:hypothetical protein
LVDKLMALFQLQGFSSVELSGKIILAVLLGKLGGEV